MPISTIIITMLCKGLWVIIIFSVSGFTSAVADPFTKLDSATFTPRLIHFVEPKYPAKATGHCINVDVELAITLNRQGEVKRAKVISCTAPKMGFEKAATDAVKECVFLPPYFFVEHPQYDQTVRYTMKFRCYNGLIPTSLIDSANNEPVIRRDSLPEEIRNLTYTDFSIPSMLTFYPRDSAFPPLIQEADIWVKFRSDIYGRAFKPTIAFSTTADTAYTREAISVVTEGTFFSELPWVKKPDSQYIQIAFRKKKPIPRVNEYDASLVPPDTLSTYPLDYPYDASSRGQKGTVKVKILIEKDGSVSVATFDKSSGYYALDFAAVQAAGKYKYKPAMMNDTLIRIWALYDVKFLR